MPTGLATRSLVPDEVMPGYGIHPNLAEGGLQRVGFPLAGRVVRDGAYPSPAIITIHTGQSEFPEQVRRLQIWQAAYDAVINGIGRTSDTPLGLGVLLHPNPGFVFRWRILAALDPWTEVPGEFLSVNLSTATTEVQVPEGTITEGNRIVGQVKIEDRRLDPTDIRYDATAPDLPATDDIIEFFLIGPIPPDDLHEAMIEGITDGEYCVNAYNGLYSARDPLTGAVVPTGIKYDGAAFAQMTNPVRMRHSKPVEDVRDHLEKLIYGPSGMTPALDAIGQISPVSRIPPTDTTGLVVINNAITKATPLWSAGHRIINVVRFIYPRDYSIGKPDMPPRINMIVRQNLLASQDVVLEFRDEISIERHGEQLLELDGSAYRAIGFDTTEDDVAPGVLPPRRGFVSLVERILKAQGKTFETAQPIVRPAVHVVPVGSGIGVAGNIEDEVGWQLAQLAGTHLLNRFSLGAPTMSVPVHRAAIPDTRVGDWVILDLSWFPDYVTQRRGLITLAQIVAIADLNCGWRNITAEVANAVTIS